jgi:hypothetical protein
VSRTDRTVRYWAGSRTYLGQPPPRRLLRWPELRRVRVETERGHPLDARDHAHPALGTVRRLLDASPLTALLNAGQHGVFFDLSGAAICLRDREIARYVVHEYLHMGLPQVAPALAEAVLALAKRQPRGEACRLTLALLCHLHVLAVMGSGTNGELEPPPPSFGPQAQDFVGLFAVAWQAGWLPAHATGDAALRARLERHAHAAVLLAGPARMGALKAAFELEGGRMDPGGKTTADR